MINTEDVQKNKKLIDYEDLRDIVIANAVKKMRDNKKIKEKEQDRLLVEF
ncbi:hypothetical protein KY333_00210 [Candidatus Woesearchaeota archaeon]|nr:hypothetical protein [Candidatus Woesearchaeota archaeon]MBW2994706.1 hypothetical protein [Candidatus Woesearchaeota archaeon]